MADIAKESVINPTLEIIGVFGIETLASINRASSQQTKEIKTTTKKRNPFADSRLTGIFGKKKNGKRNVIPKKRKLDIFSILIRFLD